MPLNVDKIETGSLYVNGSEITGGGLQTVAVDGVTIFGDGTITNPLSASTIPPPSYKVYSALLTQSGGDNPESFNSGQLTKGYTYIIDPNVYSTDPWDFSNVGGPNYPDSTPFVATESLIPNSYGGCALTVNSGAPVVTVLENTLGINLTFGYLAVGVYTVNNPNGWDRTKLWYGTSGLGDSGGITVNPGKVVMSIEGPNPDMLIVCYNNDCSSTIDQQLLDTPIEIRVYN